VRQLNSQLQLNFTIIFSPFVAYVNAFAADYRKQTVAMIKQDIKKYSELEGVGGALSVNMEFA
jgi:hypothetical protein